MELTDHWEIDDNEDMTSKHLQDVNEKDDEVGAEEDEENDERVQDATAEGASSVIAKILKLAENVHECGYVQVWHLINPQQPTVILKLFATSAQVEEIRSSNIVPPTMALPLAVLPGNIEVAVGDVSKVVTCILVDVILCVIIRCSNSDWMATHWWLQPSLAPPIQKKSSQASFCTACLLWRFNLA